MGANFQLHCVHIQKSVQATKQNEFLMKYCEH